MQRVNPARDNGWAKGKALEMRRAAQILLDRAAELEALAGSSGTPDMRSSLRVDPVRSDRPYRAEGSGVLSQIDTGTLATLRSDSRRPRRTKQRPYR